MSEQKKTWDWPQTQRPWFDWPSNISPKPENYIPAVLIAYDIVRAKGPKAALQRVLAYNFSQLIVDSGAFAAWRRGLKIDLYEYADFIMLCQGQGVSAEFLTLDVINDWRATLKNTEKLNGLGCRVVPAVHMDCPTELVRDYAKAFPKISVGGVAHAVATRNGFIDRVFSVAGSCRVHGLGISDQRDILAFPWDSADSASWQQFGIFGQSGLFRRGIKRVKLWSEFEEKGDYYAIARTEAAEYVKLERAHRTRWPAANGVGPFRFYLALSASPPCRWILRKNWKPWRP